MDGEALLWVLVCSIARDRPDAWKLPGYEVHIRKLHILFLMRIYYLLLLPMKLPCAHFVITTSTPAGRELWRLMQVIPIG